MSHRPSWMGDSDATRRYSPQEGASVHETSSEHSSAQTPAGAPVTGSDLELPVTIGGRYELQQLRGGGGMAKVYRARDLTLDRDVAVKLINPEIRSEPEFDARFEREAKIVSKLSDPHIVAVHDFGIDAAHGPYLVMEYLQGESLRERLSSQGPLPFRAGLQIAGQILLALIHAHNKSIIHRDIKPDNVVLASQSGVRLLARVVDFGIARIYHDDAADGANLTEPGIVPGTPRYMAPEQLAGQPVDARSDLYSVALVIHELLTGKMPFGGRSLSELCPEAPESLQLLLEQCLKSNPAERPDSAVEVYLRVQELGKASGVLLIPPGSLDHLLAARVQPSDQPTLPYDASKASRSRKWLVWGGAMILAAGLGAALYWILSNNG